MRYGQPTLELRFYVKEHLPLFDKYQREKLEFFGSIWCGSLPFAVAKRSSHGLLLEMDVDIFIKKEQCHSSPLVKSMKDAPQSLGLDP